MNCRPLHYQSKESCAFDWIISTFEKRLNSSVDREEAIVGVPEDRIERSDFGRKIERDLSTPENEYAALMYPMSHVFDWDRWQDGFDEHWSGDAHKAVREEFRAFKRQILENFKYYPRRSCAQIISKRSWTIGKNSC